MAKKLNRPTGEDRQVLDHGANMPWKTVATQAFGEGLLQVIESKENGSGSTHNANAPPADQRTSPALEPIRKTPCDGK